MPRARIMRGLRAIGVGTIALAAVLDGGCRSETLDKPPAPAMNDVLDELASPSGTFDSQVARAIRAAIDTAVIAVLDAGVAERVATTIEEAVRRAREARATSSSTTSNARGAGSLEVRAFDFSAGGVARVTRICDGWGPVPVADEDANGHLSLTVTFDETKIDSVVWGDVERCLFLPGGRRLRLERGSSNSDLRVYVGEGTRLDALASTPLVMAFDVAATLEDRSVALKVAVRLVASAADVEVLVPVPDGHVVVSLSGAGVVRLRAKNGTFTCDPQTRRCTGTARQEVPL